MDGRDGESIELPQGQVSQDAADEAQEQPFQEERPADEPVRRATYFMMAISLRRAKTVRRIVLEMMNSMARVRKMIKQCRPSG